MSVRLDICRAVADNAYMDAYGSTTEDESQSLNAWLNGDEPSKPEPLKPSIWTGTLTQEAK
jgi:hypothetical protein